jgi:hypothetical protein
MDFATGYRFTHFCKTGKFEMTKRMFIGFSRAAFKMRFGRWSKVAPDLSSPSDDCGLSPIRCRIDCKAVKAAA